MKIKARELADRFDVGLQEREQAKPVARFLVQAAEELQFIDIRGSVVGRDSKKLVSKARGSFFIFAHVEVNLLNRYPIGSVDLDT